jgi:hypothetical protein
MNVFKLTCPKWHIHQVGYMGKRTTQGDIFIDFSSKNYYDFLLSMSKHHKGFLY